MCYGTLFGVRIKLAFVADAPSVALDVGTLESSTPLAGVYKLSNLIGGPSHDVYDKLGQNSLLEFMTVSRHVVPSRLFVPVDSFVEVRSSKLKSIFAGPVDSDLTF